MQAQKESDICDCNSNASDNEVDYSDENNKLHNEKDARRFMQTCGFMRGLEANMKQRPTYYDELLEEALEDCGVIDENKEIFSKAFANVVAETKAKILESQKDLAGSDNTKLDNAFAELEKDGIITRQCYPHDIYACERAITEEAKDTHVGFVYYNDNDANRIMEGRRFKDLYINFGALDKKKVDKSRQSEIGDKLKAQIEAHGLTGTFHQGDVGTGIFLAKNFKWKKACVTPDEIAMPGKGE